MDGSEDTTVEVEIEVASGDKETIAVGVVVEDEEGGEDTTGNKLAVEEGGKTSPLFRGRGRTGLRAVPTT